MLGTDPSDIAFNLYRSGVKVNAAPITGATNLLDEAGTDTSVYLLKIVIGGREKVASKETSVWQNNYMSIPLQKPEGGITKSGEAYTYSANDTSVGDVDGDGTYELIVKWDPSTPTITHKLAIRQRLHRCLQAGWHSPVAYRPWTEHSRWSALHAVPGV